MAKHIFVTGGVVSGLGKGITAASLGRLLKARGVKVAAQKLDPYINMDPGTMSPLQHGEVFVTQDGAETDLDLGHYERFMDEDLTRYSNLTTGKVYWNVLQKERRGEFLGQTIQVVPHITDEIKSFIYKGAQESGADVLITEVGGTIGDIESRPFLEAIRQITLERGRGDCLTVHVTLVPYIPGSEELKSKPTQHSVNELQSMGIMPGVIVTRCDTPLPGHLKAKIAMFCNVGADCVIENLTLKSLYEAPLMLHKNGLDDVVCRQLGIAASEPDLTEWGELTDRIAKRGRDVNIALVGKYTELHDAYLSVAEALRHAGYAHCAQVNIEYVDSDGITPQNAGELLGGSDGIIVPGGFGARGTRGMTEACMFARMNDVPCLGICLGMQIMAIEFARTQCGLDNANSTEFDIKTPHPVIDLMEYQRDISDKGGTMRLGAYPCAVKPGTLLSRAFGQTVVHERHRHRYEFNNAYRDVFTQNGMVFSGLSPDGLLCETIELKSHPFYLGVQFHPEFKSRPNKPHPVFAAFVEAASKLSRSESFD